MTAGGEGERRPSGTRGMNLKTNVRAKTAGGDQSAAGLADLDPTDEWYRANGLI